ncbi:MAG TPA: single-stranded DNA-binding protein [Candidatus Megaira endosymbiont of Hartmannula sinica]|nr:single-stranded DNA-binding protein [Candidatus Megaera endosymbiont of Hartmannula sinica]
MARSLNKVTLIGNVGNDPDVRTTSQGKDFVSFPMATSDRWKDKATSEDKERTEWHRVVIYNTQLVEIVKKYVKKGAKIYLEGSLSTRKWQDNTGSEKYTTEIVIRDYGGSLILLDGRNSDPSSMNNNNTSSYNNSHSNNNSGARGNNGKLNHDDLDDEIPF